ncbi:D-alanyl-D-alanine carboxypeptidase [Loigolactobacillus backii]|nr:D-alanyl-D-alanine carboxypeptidase [Loigolactobacillus backii]
MVKKIVSRIIVILTLSLLGVATVSQPSAAATQGQLLDAKAGIAVDASSGQILYQQNAKQVLPIGSMTKMVLIYLTLQAIKEGKLTWNTEVPVDQLAYRLTQDKDLTNVPLEENGHYTVGSLYQAALVASANSAAVLLGNAVAGSQTGAVNQMRTLLKRWGIEDAKIVNTSGLNNSYLGDDRYPNSASTAENEMSAADVAIAAQHLMADYPEVLETTKQRSLPFQVKSGTTTTMKTWNTMLPGESAAVSDLPVDGLKTGTTDLAGECFAGTVSKNGNRIITVVMHANQAEKDKNARFTETAKLMHEVFNTQTKQTWLPKGAQVNQLKTLAVPDGKNTAVKIGTKQALTFWAPTAATSNQIKLSYQLTKAATKKQLAAPVKAQQKVGTATIQSNDYLPGYSVPKVTLVTQTSVAKATFGQQVSRFFQNIF